MISKVIPRKTGDNFGRLAEYLAAANDKGEKLDQLWLVNCVAGESKEDLGLAITEIEHTQAQNVRSKADKTYHMVVSFKNQKPASEALQEIEREFAKALGFEDHQRIVATHQNTDNFHMHVAYSKIHPEKLINHSPKWDYMKREKVCREMELKYGLSVDLGKEDKKKEKEQISSKAKDFEAKTWEQSFDSFAQVHKEALLEIRENAKTWEDIHQGFAEYGMKIQVRGNGLSIKDIETNAAMKASNLDRSYSKAAMEKEFGPFKNPEKALTKTRKSHYSRKPITKYEKQSNAWKKYLGHVKRKETLAVKGFRNWRDFLTYEAMSDPLAAAIIGHHKKLIKLTENILEPQRATSSFGKMKPTFLLIPLPEQTKSKGIEAELKTNSENDRWYERSNINEGGLADWRISKDRANNQIAREVFRTWKDLKTWATSENSNYLKDRKIKGYGIKIAEDGELVIPLRNIEGKIQSLQVAPEGKKESTEDNENQGYFHVIDPKQELRKATEKSVTTIIISQDYAIGATLHEATRHPVIVSLNNDNILPVAKSIREQYPDAKIVIAANSTSQIGDKKSAKKTKAHKIVEAALAVGGKVLAPKFNTAEKSKGFSDWNDLLKERGPYKTARQIKSELKKLTTSQIVKKKKSEFSL